MDSQQKQIQMELENDSFSQTQTISDKFNSQIKQSVYYIKALQKQKDSIQKYFQDLLSDTSLLTLETKINLQMQQKWFNKFFDGFCLNDDDQIQQHMNLKENIFNQYSNFLKDFKCSFYTIFIKDLKYLPDIEYFYDSNSKIETQHNNQDQIAYEYDSLKFIIAISHLVLYIYYYFLHKHKMIYLTNEMFNAQPKLIDIASISHIDYIIYFYENYSENAFQEEGESLEDSFKLEIVDYDMEIDQFDNFLETIKLISEVDEDIIKFIPKIEDLYGFFLAKQQTIQLWKENNRKKQQLENMFYDVVETSILSMSIHNNKYIDNKNFNQFYLHPYIIINNLAFNHFVSPTRIVQENMKENIPFFDTLYSIILAQFRKIFLKNCFISNDSSKQSNKDKTSIQATEEIKISLKQSKKSTSKEPQTRQQRMELQKCLNLIQETILATKSSVHSFSKLAEQIFLNIT
ncbi:transmembrane protein, putative (macronuclear) [Tetrahymena thermophila SB210]|uniref:Transmembrane protein, putative n=1 Tax=Tetrahymena thermophila (strain SB210) TaxID=312017 RepID=Q22CN7_TETTS|nr:transmembrane protein, putative [Tetrahymena thermophila SB210]EAR83078.2 transmembrane protein, putative [Tetrahymena thermophila SB210]|eukprot:XP_001030741.2 transmembrane protein, putative [Tetrahymena thermophila SB210]